MKTVSGQRFIKILLIVFLLCSMMLSGRLSYADYTKTSGKKNVLILNSYHNGFLWTDNIVKGIEGILNSQDEEYNIKVEYMDTKIVNNETHFESFYNLFKNKYKGYNFDVIIASDDDAFLFLKEYHEDLFGDTPVVVCGINDSENYISQKDKIFTGIAETTDIKETINLALNFHKNAKKMIVTYDETLLGESIDKSIREIIPDYEERVEFILIQDDELNEIIKRLKEMPKDSIILQCGVYKGNSNELLSIKEGNEIMSKAVNMPIYVLWDVSFGDGVLGGKVTNSYYTGKAAAKKALRILKGESVENIPYDEKSPTTYMFNYKELKRFQIDEQDLPSKCIIINKPSTSINVSKQLIYLVIGFIALILIVINTALMSVVSKMRRVKQEIFKEKNILEGILEATADGIIVVDEGTTQILRLNKNFKDMWGIPKEIIKGKDSKRLIEYMKNQLKGDELSSNKLKAIISEGNYYTDVIELADGRVYERCFKQLLIDDSFKGSVWSFRDITKRVNFEKELKKSEALYRKLIHLLPDAVFVRKGDEITIANESALRLIGCANIDEMYKTDIKKLIRIHKDCSANVSEMFRKLQNEEATVGFSEHKMVLRDKHSVLVEIGASSFKHENDKYIVSVIRDISERKKAEELQKKIIEKNLLLSKAKEYDRLKTDFFSTISHELKTPLNIILSGVQLLNSIHKKDKGCTNHDTSMRYIKMMKQNCYRLLKLINNLIDITRIDSGFMKLNLKNHNIVKIIEDISLSVADYFKSKDLTLIFDTDTEEKIIACDVEKLERIMLNLLSNAVKFSTEGEVIDVTINDKGENVIITVKDRGIGIPDDMKNKIFDRFRQVDSSLSRKVEGSGIGLSLVKSLINLHGGEIHVNSKLGEGSEFIITLPVYLANNSDIANEEIASAGTSNVERISIEFSDIYS